ncbi:MAG: glutamate-5-semialdehyde dehydrogenase, partial [Muribaculaceae bacterium]|nr:glutamate-5-semialdehyde dehydrogenase [Muribaculaceae bacterium]
MELNEIFKKVKAASRTLSSIDDDKRNEVLLKLADLLEANRDMLLEANKRDLDKMSEDNPLYDRLKLTEERIAGIAGDIRNVATLPSPVGEVLEERTLPNGIRLKKVSVPFGVIGVIYEARPNVTFDVFSICFKSGNACILKGGKDAEESNLAAMEIIHRSLREEGVSENVAELLPATHDATAALLNAVGYVDVCIPRGGRKLIDFVRDNAKVPVIETGAGVVHLYFDDYADYNVGIKCVANSKLRRPSVCNALDTLLVHQDRIWNLPELTAPLAEKRVELHVEPCAMEILKNYYPNDLLVPAREEDWDTEWMDYKMGIK